MVLEKKKVYILCGVRSLVTSEYGQFLPQNALTYISAKAQ